MISDTSSPLSSEIASGLEPLAMTTLFVFASDRRERGNLGGGMFLEIASSLMLLAKTRGVRLVMTQGTTRACSQLKVEDTLIL